MTLQEILGKLGDAGLKRNGEGKWQARCPAHADSSPSLSIGQGVGGRVLLNCFAGCKAEDIATAMGVTIGDLFDGKEDSARETLPPDRWPVTDTYTYRAPSGQPLYRVLRMTSPDSGKKTFRQQRRDGGDWVPGMEGVPRVLYRLPGLLAASFDQPVYFVEGEKDVENLVALGLTATTNVGGAGKLQGFDPAAFAGRDVVILPDNDKPGLAHGEAVRAALDRVARSVKVVRLPVGEKGDVSDWLRSGGTAEELARLVAKADTPAQAFESSADRIRGERSERLEMGRNRLTFGVKYLDDALGGIMPRDLIIVGAKTGTGKTQLATIAALANCKAGKRVHYFALEAEDREIERRMKYQIASELYYRQKMNPRRLRYLDWYQGDLDRELGEFDDQAERQMADLTKNLRTFYRVRSFTSEDFCRQLEAIKNETDMVVLDHFHFVDSTDDNENRAFKKTAKQIRDIALEFQKPIIVVAHVRKLDRRHGALLPDIEDFHGSSDVPKMATKVVMIAPDFETPTGSPSLWSTYMHVAKCRADSSVTRYAARLDFNTKTDSYAESYTLGRLTDQGRMFEALNDNEWPSWKSNASSSRRDTAADDDNDPWFGT